MSTLRTNCLICGAWENLIRCNEGCMFKIYCGEEHRLADRAEHLAACNALKKSRNKLETEDTRLRNPYNWFRIGIGKFWKIEKTQEYMRALFSHMDYLMKIKSYDAVKSSFDHAMEAFRLCHTDDLRVRMVVPALFVRLGKDQECYDFIKYSAMVGCNFNWTNINVRDADAFEPIDVFDGVKPTLEYALAAFLIKMRLLTDLKTLQSSLFLYTYFPFPQELVDRIRKLAIDEIVAARTEFFYSENLDPMIEMLVTQIEQLFQVAKKANMYFWPGFLDPSEFLAAKPPTFFDGTLEHAQTTTQIYLEAFIETPGSIQMARELAAKNGIL
ncbi:hypothetical protein HA402_004894 [Bradysia odoriphaga]|nr:hypothetical protein HA402_004894 [Bradysia odoriphaga]